MAIKRLTLFGYHGVKKCSRVDGKNVKNGNSVDMI